jgi:hypothetical protein
MSAHVRNDLELLHQSLLDGKLPRNLSWTETIDLIGHLGKVESHGNDEFAFVVGTQRAFFKHPHTHALGVEEVSRLRKFLKEAGPVTPTEPNQPCRMVVVVDHHAAHLYRDLNGTRPEADKTVRPYDPFGFHHHLIHRKEANYKGERIPEETSFYEEIAQALVPANEIVLIGHGTGRSSAVDVLKDYLEQRHPQIFQHVIATETADLSSLTEPQVEALAKKHMITVV